MKIVVLFSSYTRNGYSDKSLLQLIDGLKARLLDAEFIPYVLPELFKDLPPLH